MEPHDDPRRCRFCRVVVGTMNPNADGTLRWTPNGKWASAVDGAPPHDYRCKDHAGQRPTGPGE